MNIKYLLLVMAVLLATMLTGCATAPVPSDETSIPKTVKTTSAHQVERAEKKDLPKNTPPLAKNSSIENPAIKDSDAIALANSPTQGKKALTKMAWQVTVIQDATALENNHEKVSLKKAPFSIRVTLPKPNAVRFAAAPVQSDLEASHTDRKLTTLCSSINLTPFCLNKAISIAYVNHNHNLSLEKFTHHYFFHRKNMNHSWMKVHITPQQTTLEWTIKTINNKPIASYKGSEIYMTLWVDSQNRLIFDEGELKQLLLSFSN